MRLHISLAACALISGCILNAQTISFGFKGGAILAGPSSDSSSGVTSLHFENRRYTIGPLIEIGLPRNFAVEFSPLYKRLGFSETVTIPGQVAFTGSSTDPIILPGSVTVLRERMNAWEFPIVGKYYFAAKNKSIRPFVLTGYSFTKSWVSFQQSVSSPSSPGLGFATFPVPVGVGAVFGGGVLAHKSPVNMGPEFRYTRNGVSGRNQAEILFSVRF
jgi:hypothetical protein